MPEGNAALVLVNDVLLNGGARTVRAGTTVCFICEYGDTGKFMVSVPGKHGSLPTTFVVHPHDVTTGS